MPYQKIIMVVIDGERKDIAFPVKAHHTKNELVVREEPHKEIKDAVLSGDYKGSYYKEVECTS